MSLTLTACSKVLGAAYWASSVKEVDRLVTFPECCVCVRACVWRMRFEWALFFSCAAILGSLFKSKTMVRPTDWKLR